MDILQPLEALEWIARPKVLALRRLGITTAEDLVMHYPRRYEDRHEFPHFPREESDQPICLCGEVTKTSIRRFGGWKKIFEATLEESEANALTQPLTLRWFNMHYIQKMIAVGQQLIVFGKPRLRSKRLCMDHPEFEVVEDDPTAAEIHFRRITPIYPATEGVSQRLLRSIIYRVLKELSDEPLETLLPTELDRLQRRTAISQIHFPTSWESLAASRQHLILSEFFAIQMLIVSRRNQSHSRPGAVHCGCGELLDRFLQALPFELTSGQKKVVAEIRQDLAAARPMNRLLQGDVGSGKTVVAIAAMLLAAEAGYQSAFMAPTQILAEQHYGVLRRWLEPLRLRLSIRTATRQEDTGPLPLFENSRKQDEDDEAQDVINGYLGSARVSRAGNEVPSSRTFSEQAAGAGYSRRRLPHFEKPWAIYAITIATKSRRSLSPEARTIALNALRHFHNQRYELFAACVMPDHLHALFQPWPEKTTEDGEVAFWPLPKLLRSLKSFTAHKINEIERTSGAVWEKETLDRYIRSDSDLEEKFHYILRNPWDSGVAQANDSYPWVWTQDDECRSKSSSRQNAATNTRDACAPQQHLSDQPHIIVGTHALLYEGVSFSNLGLVIIDEQHKFGVAQRARLIGDRPGQAHPDVLVMTATPIPRTLTMTVYGDLDVSTIEEMPQGRGKIVTAVRGTQKLGEVLSFLRKELESGRQAYVVYPLIEESDKLDVKAAAKEFEQWQERLRPFRCALLHGRLPTDEKQMVMEQFRTHQVQVLVSTTVIEVGVDVSNATVMLIENAERFGLAQLHQLRGRIGRGAHKSYCVLLTNDSSPETMAKLNVLEATANGFEVAEADWQLRGPGDLLGTAQTGLPALRIGDLKRDAHLMQTARKAALSIFATDPGLDRPENQRFRSLIVEQQGRTFSNVS